MDKKRTIYTPEQKVSILKKHLVDGAAISDICDETGLHPTVFYRWQKAFFENGAMVFQEQKSKKENGLFKKISVLEEKLAKKNEVVSELMEAHLALKKTLGES